MKTIDESGVVRISRQGSPAVFEYISETVVAPKEYEVLISQKAIALNFVDVLFRNGSFPLNKLPATLGVEASGIVEAVGSRVTEWKIGDRVAYYFSLGAYAEKRLIHQDQLIRLPVDVSFDEAASLLAKGLTARMLVKEAYSIQAGDTILVHAAAGGVGSLVSRWAKSLGATVIGTVGVASKKALVQSQGVDLVIALDSEDTIEKVNSFTKDQGVQAVFDGVGKATFGISAQVVQKRGTVVLYGGASGTPQIDTAYLAAKEINLVRPTLSQYLPDKQSLDTAVEELFEAFRRGVFGEIKPTSYSLTDVAKAHQDLEAGLTTGSIIFHP
ncbi:quinone oxidoreductase family protein [Spirosoma foliorum]|uniref:Quinone oxidoreductase n=1 Tax=Spirosoma foliorum TaxID=2710596 RepID=A0A7G5H0I7_9BACT|nr:quinone oxidoreductase [Spirosoma foliorum]QMW04629.1 quinone oxidoreductase [Spirosoma foliorum]